MRVCSFTKFHFGAIFGAVFGPFSMLLNCAPDGLEVKLVDGAELWHALDVGGAPLKVSTCVVNFHGM